MRYVQRIRDPLHGLIGFVDREFERALWEVVQTEPFQRLRRIRQLGFSELVYPAATHSRLSHSLGVFHIARELMGIVEEFAGRERFLEQRAQRAIAAALVHDLGHGPFSHAFEDVGKRLKFDLASNHEKVSDILITQSEVADKLNVLGSGFADDVANVINSDPSDMYDAVVSSQFDADRLDYMQRDRLMSGTMHGGIDYLWLKSNLEIAEVPTGVDGEEAKKVETFVLSPKAKQAAEAYVLSLFHLYPTLYLHKTTRGAEKIYTEIFCRMVEKCRNGDAASVGLSADHPIAKFACEPERIENITGLDDMVVWGALGSVGACDDALVRDFSKRLTKRELYKSINVHSIVRGDLKQKLDAGAFKSERVNAVCKLIGVEVKDLQKSTAVGGDKVPIVLWDAPTRRPYKHVDQSDGPLNQIHIRVDDNELLDLGRFSNVIGAIEPYHQYRAYFDPDADGIEEKILGIVSEEVNKNVTR